MFGVFTTVISLSLVISIQSKRCGRKLFTNDNGLISSPKYPSKYPPGMVCTYEIKAPLNHRIQLSWEHQAIWDEMPNCFSGSIRIYVGCGISRRYLSRFCSKYKLFRPHDIYSKDGCMRIEFRNKGFDDGFKVRYKFLQMNDLIRLIKPVLKETKKKPSKLPYGFISLLIVLILSIFFAKRSFDQRMCNNRENNTNSSALPIATNSTQIPESNVTGTTTTIDAPFFIDINTQGYPPTSAYVQTLMYLRRVDPSNLATSTFEYQSTDLLQQLSDGSQASSKQMGVYPPINNTADGFQTALPPYKSNVNHQMLPPVDVVNAVENNVG